MKKLFTILCTALISTAFLSGCNSSTPAESDGNTDTAASTITVAATPAPHAEILQVAKEVLAEQGINLEIKEFNDYVIPNTATESGEVDANYFQHKPYLDDFNEKNSSHLVSVAAIHYEPFGIYAGKTSSIEEIKDGAKVSVPNDTTNEARALLLLEAQGLIKLKEGAGLTATKLDIVENPKNLNIQEIEAAQLARTLADVDLAVINGNYAIQAGLNVSDALAIETQDSEAAQTYANIVAVKEGNENNDNIKALVAALESDKVKQFMEEKYQGAVVPMF